MTGVAIRVPVIPESRRDGYIGRLLDTWNLLTCIEFWRLVRWALIEPLTGTVLAIIPFGFVDGVYGMVVMPILSTAAPDADRLVRVHSRRVATGSGVRGHSRARVRSSSVS